MSILNFIACSKLEAMSIYLVKQGCGNDILASVYIATSSPPKRKKRRGWVKNLYIKGLLLSILCLRKFFDIQRFPSFFTVTRTEFLAWLILGMEYYLHKWFLHTTGLLRYHGPQKSQDNFQRPQIHFFRNLLFFCLIWTVLTWEVSLSKPFDPQGHKGKNYCFKAKSF